MGVSPIWFKARPALLALPFVLIAAIALGRLLAGPGWGLLPLLAVGPAVRYTLAAGVEALAICGVLLADVQPGSAAHRTAIVGLLAIAGVTAAGTLASWARGRRDRQLAQVRLVAEAAQRVVLRPVPPQIGSVRFAVRYLSASSQARVGGDLYEVVATDGRVRLVVGDAEGKGLPALQSAAQVLGVFREAAHEEDSLTAIVSRIETSLARQLGAEQFVTAVLAEISEDGAKMELLSCGHPAPLLLGESPPRLARLPDSLPLGLGDLSDEPRIPVTIPLAPGDEVLFYTDGATEARSRAGEFFALADCDAVRLPHRPEHLVDQLSAELARHVGHAPDDDIALLLVYRERSLLAPGTSVAGRLLRAYYASVACGTPSPGSDSTRPVHSSRPSPTGRILERRIRAGGTVARRTGRRMRRGARAGAGWRACGWRCWPGTRWRRPCTSSPSAAWSTAPTPMSRAVPRG